MLDVDLLRELTAEGHRRFIQAVAEASDILVPNPDVDIVEWIESHIVIPPSVSPTRPGPMRLTVVQKLTARRMQKRGVRRVALLKTPRIGSTMFNVAMLLYFACHKGVDVIFYERTDPQAQDFHDKKLYPVMMASPKIRVMMRPDTRSGVQDKWSDRVLRNGASIQLRSGFGDGSARAIKGEFVGVDEASSKEFQPNKVDGEGNKVEKIWARAQEFAAPIMYVGGTPTNEGTCVVTQEFRKGDQCVIEMQFKCCGSWQEFVPDVQRVASTEERRGAGLRYMQDEHGLVTDVWYECGNPDCRSCVPETEKSVMLKTGRLRETNAAPFDPLYSSIYIWMAYSEDPQGTWLDIAKKHRDQLTDPTQRQTFMNLWLAKAWVEEPPRAIPVSELEKRAIDYGDADLPAYATDLFGGIDNQAGGLHKLPRSELVWYGAGPNQRRAIGGRQVIAQREIVNEDGEVETVYAEPFTRAWMEMIWAELDKPRTTADGRVLRLSDHRTGFDVGWRMHEALAFCHHPESRRRGIFPVRGRKEMGLRVPILPNSLSTHNKSGMQFAMIAGQTAKDYIYESLKNTSGTAHSWDFPNDIQRLGEDFYEQLLSEGLTETRPGSKIFMWDKIKADAPNEVLDCTVYAICAELYSCRRNRETRKRLAVQFDALPATGEDVVLNSAQPVAHHAAAMDHSVEPDAPDEGGENVAASQAPAKKPLSINPTVVRRPKRQPDEKPSPEIARRAPPRRASIVNW